jgi:multicomponent K+:H+ antiporter subunit A
VFVTATPMVERLLPIVATVAGMFSVVYSLRFTADVFFGPDTCAALPKRPHEPPHWMRVPIEVLVLTCLLVGVAPQWAVQDMLNAAAAPVVGGVLPSFDLAVWHGLNLPLVMSLVALAGGMGLYWLLRGPMEHGHLQRTPLLSKVRSKQIFRGVLAGLTVLSRRALRGLGTQRLQPQLMLLVSLTAGSAVATLWLRGLGPVVSVGTRPLLPFSPLFGLLWAVGIGAALGAVWQAKYHRLTALALMSVSGLVTVVTFAWFSAPDLALTQFSVEVVTTVLILLGLRWLPKRLEEQVPRRTWWGRLKVRTRRARDLALALLAGTGMATLSYALMTRPFEHTISPFFLTHALPEGGGRNVVNVMLVDFRGLDTLGEITVLGVVALTVYALLRRFRPARESTVLPPQQQAVPADLATDLINPHMVSDPAQGYLMVPAVLVRLVLPLAAVVAVYLFMRGHNAPGGGFVAGLVLSTAFILQYIVSGTQWVELHMHLRPQRWIATGLLIATATGLGAFVLGYPFLTTHTAHVHLPLIGSFHVASALFYDIGVFALVVGATLLILTALGHQSVRGHRRPRSAPPVTPAPLPTPLAKGGL